MTTKRLADYVGPVRSLAHVRRVAQRILQDFPQQETAVDVMHITAALGVRVVAAPPKQESPELVGALVKHDGQYTILYNEGTAPGVQRFSVARLLGLALINNRSDPQLVFRDEAHQPRLTLREVQIQAFAEELLMPPRVIEALVPRPINSLNEALVTTIAETLGVPLVALSAFLRDRKLLV